MYLEIQEIDMLFSFVRNHSGLQSSIVFTFMESEKGKIRFRNSSVLVDKWLSLCGEVFTWGLPREGIGNYLASVGFDSVQIATDETLRDRYLSATNLKSLPLAQGECICIAKINIS